ncbi:MAG: FAD-dependent oxidoreductase [Bacteroidales bacterium]|jgi:formate dehydrogenase major subunit|nr:FAD-dependent oxidoreductase [Bacteroidales bacterium]HOI31435.1 FAD-dependent oxidoreductase [Bacteroidales bacterium]
MSQYFNIELNGQIVQGFQGETIYECASRYGIEIPTLCHDPRIKPYSSCYVCVVEVEGMRGHQPSCSTYLIEGMKINTEKESVKQARKTALDLLLSNHYADCLGPCKQHCPAGVDVQGYISLIDKSRYSDAVALIKETNPLPAICGRVCVRPCEAACRRNLLDEGAPVGIDYLKRFAADYDLASPTKFIPKIKAETGKKVAVIGAGPGGLSTAHFLRLEGHQVEIFEAAPKSGGWLRYGIPEYRLPNDILDKEVENITDLGVRIHYNKNLGETLSYAQIRDNFDATILTIGSQKGTAVGCPGDDAHNVFAGITILKNMEMTGQRPDFSGKTVVVVGGGNTAMDCCRTAIRGKAQKVFVVYRRTEKEMPANPIEIHESKLEGVEYLFLTNPVEIIKDENNTLQKVKLIRMALGEPDASGRRRPLPVPDSEFEIEADYVFAAIGQKTDVNFIDDINTNTTEGKLVVNRWGDIEANKHTLQTGIPSVFAAGDGVSGPATIIEAIAQAKIAAHSCHQYLNGMVITPPIREFLSKKENFKVQDKNDYIGHFLYQKRHEMPVLPAEERINFKEVELGYENENVAQMEASRCLECGCSAFFDCDLKKHSTTYQAEQKSFPGEFQEHHIDFRHPFIEIDNNKCILCSRCIRICQEVVGANALGLINRGFKSLVAPALGLPLQETSCESCGMCITACPTGALTENYSFKPGPLKLEPLATIDMFGSEGYEINLLHHRGQFYKAMPRKAEINRPNYINRRAFFGYKLFNNPRRITSPRLKTANGFKEISFEEAYKIIHKKIKSVEPDENAFFGGARLTNEELYLIQKLARAGTKTNNVSSFHYMGRGDGYFRNSNENASYCDIRGASKIFVAGGELHLDHPVINHLIFNTKHKENLEVVHITTLKNSRFSHKADKVVQIDNYFYFIQAVNHWLIANNQQNSLFIKDRTEDFEAYKTALLQADFSKLLEFAGTDEETIAGFAKEYNEEMNAIMIFQEKALSANASMAMHNLAMITGKLGKTANGLIALKEKNNAHGIFDMGVCHKIGVGAETILDEDLQYRMQYKWKVDALPFTVNSVYKSFRGGKIKNAFIFGEDPVGCAINKDDIRQQFSRIAFVVVQDLWMSGTACMADLVLPASMPWEFGGTYTNSQRKIQQIEKQLEVEIQDNSFVQLVKLLEKFDVNGIQTPAQALEEAISLLPRRGDFKDLRFVFKEKDNENRQFDFGCDLLNKTIDEEFTEKLNW